MSSGARFRSVSLEPTSPVNLAVFRLAVFGWLLRVIYTLNFVGVVSVPAELRVASPGYGALLPRIPIDLPHVLPYAALRWSSVRSQLSGCSRACRH